MAEARDVNRALQPLALLLLLPISRSTATAAVETGSSHRPDETEYLLTESLPLIARQTYTIRAVVRFKGRGTARFHPGNDVLLEE